VDAETKREFDRLHETLGAVASRIERRADTLAKNMGLLAQHMKELTTRVSLLEQRDTRHDRATLPDLDLITSGILAPAE
jgi:hypothetical protein